MIGGYPSVLCVSLCQGSLPVKAAFELQRSRVFEKPQSCGTEVSVDAKLVCFAPSSLFLRDQDATESRQLTVIRSILPEL